MNAGYYEEAGAWRDWLLRAAAGAPSQLQIMDCVAGERRLTEYEVAWLPGYDASRPVRIGNAAHGQLQLTSSARLWMRFIRLAGADFAPAKPTGPSSARWSDSWR